MKQKYQAQIHYNTLMLKTSNFGFAACSVLSKRQLLDIMWELEIQGIIEDVNDNTINDYTIRRVLISYLTTEELNAWSNNKLKYYYNWLKQRYTKDDFCNFIKNRMIELQLI